MTQSALHIPVPPQVTVRGTFRSRAVVQNLLEDMVQYELPGGIKIDVGWYPDWDPNGAYRIVAFSNDYSSPLEPPVTTREELEVYRTVTRLIAKFSSPFHFGGGTASAVMFMADGGVRGRSREFDLRTEVKTTPDRAVEMVA